MTKVFITLAAVIGILAGQASVPAKTTWVLNLFTSRAVRYQNPDYGACTSASTMVMLNTIYYTYAANPNWLAKPGGDDVAAEFVWKPDTSYATQTRILKWERRNMTLPTWRPGSDVHGWRNALNYYGWGDINAGVYTDLAFPTFDQAAKATVRSIALRNQPVGILSWYGSHAQYVTGYSVTGDDPRTGSLNFTVNGVYLTDPLRWQGITNQYVSRSTWHYGGIAISFRTYQQRDSILKDPIDGQVGVKEWWKKYVIVAAPVAAEGILTN
jgi:hypothetical protein